MGNFFTDNDDLLFYFDKGIDWTPIVEASERRFDDPDGFQSTEEAVDFYRDVLEMIGSFVADEIAPYASEIDRQDVELIDGEVIFPPRTQAIFERIRELDLHGLCGPRELGGMNAPLIVYFMMSEIFARGDVSVMMHHGFHGGMAMAMLVFSLREGTTEVDASGKVVKTRFQEAIGEIFRGEAWGCMDITEPDAGSDMAKLRTKAEQDADGNWFITGEKIFITSGHGKYHFVIARSEEETNSDDPMAGLGGLSMFLVPTYEDLPDGTRNRIVQVTRVEEKLGHHGSATCALNFERAPGYLIGKRGDGFKHMLTLMNNARIGVGFESIGLAEAATRLARAYAAERGSMGKTIDRHEMIADYLDEMDCDLRALRALAMHCTVNEEQAVKYELALEYFGGLSDDDARLYRRRMKKMQRKSRRATPLLKYLAAEKAVEHARRAVQIHGGNGYTKEYGAEKLLRDSLVLPIYEGTSQIQSLMAMKDTLGGILKNPKRFIRRQAEARWLSVTGKTRLERRVAKLQLLSLNVQQHLMLRTVGDKFKGLRGKPVAEWPDGLRGDWNPKRDFAFAMLHAERLTRILADEQICEILLDQAQQHPERAHILERYLDRAEPRCRFLQEEITTTGDRLLRKLQGQQETAPGDEGFHATEPHAVARGNESPSLRA